MPGDAESVSVVVPTYQRAATVGRAVRSVLEQTLSPREVLVVDDGSTDDTARVVEGLRDDRVRYLRHDRNRGGSAARNTGIRAARGRFLAFQDSDDVWLPVKLERQMAVFAEAPPSVGVVYSRFWHVHRGVRTLRPAGAVTPREGRIHAALLWGNFVTTQSAVVRRECFERVGDFDERLPRYQDWELFLRIAREYRFRFVDEPLVETHQSADSISADDGTRVEALSHLVAKHAADFCADRRVWSHYNYLLGTWRCRAGDLRGGRRHLAAAVRARPARLRNLAAWLLSLGGPRLYGGLVALKHRVVPADGERP